MPDWPSAPAASSPDFFELKSIFAAAGTMIVATDAEGIVRFFNPAAERLLGWRAEEVVGKQTPAIWHIPAEVAARAAELSRKLGRTIQPGQEFFRTSCLEGNGQPADWTIVRKDGSTFPVQLTVVPLRDDQGRVTGFVGTAQDLTKHVQAEQERDRFFDLSLDMFCVAGTDGYFRRINPAFTRTLGWSHDEILARPFLDFVHPDDRAATLREVEKLSSGQPTLHFENRYLCKDGSWRWLAWTSMPQPDGLLFATGRDVTELKQAEDALRHSEQSLSITFNSIGDAVIATDAARRITRINPVAEQLTGWPAVEAVGRLVSDVFRIINEETRKPAVIPVDEVLATGKTQELANHTVLIARDGRETAIKDSAAPLRDRDGHVVGVVLTFRDAETERKFEQAMLRLNVDLERRVQERTAALSESERSNRATLNALSAHIAVLDADGIIITVNQAWSDFSQAEGASTQIVGVGTNYLAICDRAAANGDADAAAAAQAIRDVIAGKRESWFHEYPCHSPAEQRWFYCRLTRYDVDGKPRIVVAHENITSMKAAQEQLAAARARFDTLDRVSPVAIMFFDERGSCIDVNDRWCEMSGITRQAARGEGWHVAVHPEDVVRVSRDWSRSASAGESFHAEYRLLRPDGAIAWVVSQGVPTRDPQGVLRGFVRVSTDVTEAKQTEHALRLLSSELAMLGGAAFYEAVVRHLVELLNCELAFICRRDPLRPDELTTLALFADGQLQPPLTSPSRELPASTLWIASVV